MDPKAFFSIRPPGHPSPFQKQFGSEKSTEVEFPYGFPTSHVIKDCPKKAIPAAMSPIVLVCWYQLQTIFSLSASSRPSGPGISQTFEGRCFGPQLSYLIGEHPKVQLMTLVTQVFWTCLYQQSSFHRTWRWRRKTAYLVIAGGLNMLVWADIWYETHITVLQ